MSTINIKHHHLYITFIFPLSIFRRATLFSLLFQRFTVSPQVWGLLWWPLVRCCLPDYATTSQFPEFNFVHTWWINDSAPASNSGQLEPLFIKDLIRRNEWLDKEMEKGRIMEKMQPDVWGYHPVRIGTHEFAHLRGSLHYERAVDNVTDLQRVLKGKAAWIEWAK